MEIYANRIVGMINVKILLRNQQAGVTKGVTPFFLPLTSFIRVLFSCMFFIKSVKCFSTVFS